jgi:hypothetical protein
MCWHWRKKNNGRDVQVTWEFEGIAALWQPVREHKKKEVGIKRDQRKEVVILGDGLNWIMIVSFGRLE